jgi:nitroreductase
VEDTTVDLYEAIKGRRSVRKFKSTPVPKDLIEKIFEVALWAPSGMNRQNWKFFVLAGERKEELVSISSTSFQYLEPQLQKLYAEKPKIIEATRRFFKRLGEAPIVICAYFEPAISERGCCHSESTPGGTRRGTRNLLDDRSGNCCQ